MLVSSWPAHYDMPLINTVEWLQGQDVELIVITFAAAEPKYVSEQCAFLLDKRWLR